MAILAMYINFAHQLSQNGGLILMISVEFLVI